MSRYYSMQVIIQEFDMAKVEAITSACKEEWAFEELELHHMNSDPVMIGDANGNLCGGELEDEFADRIAGAVWKANNGYCKVTVHALFLEDVEIHKREREHYRAWRNKAA